MFVELLTGSTFADLCQQPFSCLPTAASLPHDVTVAAAMLNVTLLLSQFAEDELKDNVRGMTEKWLTKSAFHLTGT